MMRHSLQATHLPSRHAVIKGSKWHTLQRGKAQLFLKRNLLFAFTSICEWDAARYTSIQYESRCDISSRVCVFFEVTLLMCVSFAPIMNNVTFWTWTTFSVPLATSSYWLGMPLISSTTQKFVLFATIFNLFSLCGITECNKLPIASCINSMYSAAYNFVLKCESLDHLIKHLPIDHVPTLLIWFCDKARLPTWYKKSKC